MANKSTSRSKENKSSTNVINGAGTVFDLSRADFNIPFFHYLTIPVNTAIENPLIYTMSLPLGMVKRLWVEFPKGCAGLAGVKIIRGVRQIFPLPDGVWLRSDNSVLNFAFSHAINQDPFSVDIVGYNLDDTYPHTIWFGFEMSGFEKDLSPNEKQLLDLLKA